MPLASLDLTDAEANILVAESGVKNPQDGQWYLRPMVCNSAGSSAYGVWQGIDSTRATHAKLVNVHPNTTDVEEQLLMFRSYCAERYGSCERAWQIWQQNKAKGHGSY